jgi:hypothetical protein
MCSASISDMMVHENPVADSKFADTTRANNEVKILSLPIQIMLIPTQVFERTVLKFSKYQPL